MINNDKESKIKGHSQKSEINIKFYQIEKT